MPMCGVAAEETPVRAANEHAWKRAWTKASAACAAIPVLAMVVLWRAGGVGSPEVLKAVGYEAGFVVLPGVAALTAVRPRHRSTLETIALGWAFGYSLEVIAFCVTAGLGARTLFLAYPPVVLCAVAATAWRRRTRCPLSSTRTLGGSGQQTQRTMPRVRVIVATGCALALAYLALGAFPVTPRPGRVAGVSYYSDLVFDVSLTTEAAHHFPPTRPWVAGLPLHYHWFVYAHAAAVVNVTGLEASTVIFRTAPLLMLMAVYLLTFVVGWSLSKNQWVGALGAAMLFLTGELNLNRSIAAPFLGSFRDNLWQSPTFLFGLLLFLAAVALLWEVLDRTRTLRPSMWVVLVPVLIVGGGAKSSVLPVLLGGVVVYGAWQWLVARVLDRRACGAAAAIAFAFALDWLVLLRGSNGYTRVDPFVSLTESAFWRSAIHNLDLPALLVPLAWLAVAAALLAPLAGILILVGRRFEPAQRLLLSLFVVAFGIFNLIDVPGVGQLYFLHYGFAAGVVLSAWGVVRAFAWLSARSPVLTRSVLLITLISTVVLLVLILNTVHAHTLGREVAAGYALFALLAGVAVLVGWLVGRNLGWTGGTVVIATLALALGAAGLDAPLHLWDQGRAVLQGAARYTPDTDTSRGLTPALLTGLRWIRSHTPATAVLAVNNHYSDPSTYDSKYLYYSAFAERRVFLESWHYTDEGVAAARRSETIQPFPGRWRLNQAVFLHADRRAAEQLHARYGVDVLVVDRVHEHNALDLSPVGRLVFSNPAVEIYWLR